MFDISLRGYLGAKVSAISKAVFRKKLSEDVANHTSFAHRLCKPVPPPPPNPCEQLEVLRTSADRWEKIWQGKLRAPPAFPSVPIASCSLPPSLLSEVFQDTSVALYRKACHSYPDKKGYWP